MGSSGAAELSFAVNLAGASNAWMSYWLSAAGSTPPAAIFTNHAPGDGICVSTDGILWQACSPFAITTAVAIASGMYQIMLPLAERLEQLGMPLTTSIWIRFQRTSSSGTTYLDDISVVQPGVQSGFSEAFESNTLNAAAWTAYSAGTMGHNRIAVGTSIEGGSYQYRMGGLDFFSSTGYRLNELTLWFRYMGEPFPAISYWMRNDTDEPHPLPNVFTNHYNGDGVSVSLDGATWQRLWTLQTAPPSNASPAYQKYTFSLTPALQQLGSESGSLVRIKFQQYDNFAYSDSGYDVSSDYYDGFAFDRITLGLQPVIPPMIETFETGVGAFVQSSTASGEIVVSNTNAPRSGSKHLLLDSTSNGVFSANTAVLYVDAAGWTNLGLAFWHKSLWDEPDPISATFSNSIEGDGVSASLDGVTWQRLTDLAQSYSDPGVYHLYAFPLSQLLPGLGTTSRYVCLRFQQYDNYRAPSDGSVLDDVSLYNYGAAADVSVRFAPLTTTLFPIATNWSYQFTVSNAGPHTATGVMVTNTIAAPNAIASVEPGQGGYSIGVSSIVFALGALVPGQCCTATVSLAITASGSSTIALSATNALADVYPGDNQASLGVIVQQPGNISWATNACIVNEAAEMVTLRLARTGGSAGTVSFLLSTIEGAADGATDYIPTNSVITLANGTTSTTFTIAIRNDVSPESTESFSVVVTPLSGDLQGGTITSTVVTITDDDHSTVGLPFFDDFESGVLGPWWGVYSNGAWAITVTNESPPTGRWQLSMETVPFGGQVDATVAILANGETNLFFGCRRRIKPWEDVDPVPSNYTGHVNADGLSLSTDGTTWRSFVPSVSGPLDAKGDVSVVAALSPVIADIPTSSTGSVWLRIQSHPDFFDSSLNGWLYDNVWVSHWQDTCDLAMWFDTNSSVVNGASILADIAISNSGPAIATGIVAFATLPGNFGLLSATCAVGSCSVSNQYVFCTVASLGIGQRADIILTGVASNPTMFTFAGTVTSDSMDREPSNDTCTASWVAPWQFTNPATAFATVPFLESFETNVLGPWWQTSGTGTFRAAISTLPAISGSRAYAMDSSAASNSALNELTLFLDTAGQTNLHLTWWTKSFGDEPQAMPTEFLSRTSGDGIAVSADGTLWHTLVSVNESSNLISCWGGAVTNAYRCHRYALDEVAVQMGQSLTGHVWIRFQQFGALSRPSGSSWSCGGVSVWPTGQLDGLAFDHIHVNLPPTLMLKATNPATGSEMSPFLLTLSASNGLAPYTIVTSDALPPGLTLYSNAISGTPLAGGNYQANMVITDLEGWTSTQSLDFTIALISNRPPLVTNILPQGITVSAMEMLPVAFHLDATDPEAVPLSIVWTYNSIPVASGSNDFTLHMGWGEGGTGRLEALVSDGLWTNRDASWNLTVSTDNDGDGMPNAWEASHGLNPWTGDAYLDPDGDGVDNLNEHLAGSDPLQPDSNNDGINDRWALDAGVTATKAIHPRLDHIVDRSMTMSYYSCVSLAVRSGFVYLAGPLQIQVFDVRGTGAPIPANSLNIPPWWSALGVAIRGDVLFYAGSFGTPIVPGISWFDVSSPPLLSQRYMYYNNYAIDTTPTFPADILAADRYVYAPSLIPETGNPGYRIAAMTLADLPAPASSYPPTFMFSLTNGIVTANSFYTACIASNRLYFGGRGVMASYLLNGAALPEGPILTPIDGAAYHVTHWSNHLLAATSSGLHIFGLSDPDRPVLLSSLKVPAFSVAATGGFAHIVGSNVYTLVSLANAMHPLVVAAQTNSASYGQFSRVVVSSNEAYAVATALGSQYTRYPSYLFKFTDRGLVDADQDGLPDEWEAAHFGNPNSDSSEDTDGDGLSNGAEFLLGLLPASADSDGDGIDDYAEFVAGTSPFDSASVLRLQLPRMLQDATHAGVEVTWNSASNRSYTLERATNLLTGFEAIASNLPGIPPLNIYTDAVTPAVYRVHVKP